MLFKFTSLQANYKYLTTFFDIKCENVYSCCAK